MVHDVHPVGPCPTSTHMSTEYSANETLDVTGLSCPMPVVKAKEAFDDLAVDDVMEVTATDPGSIADFESWANRVDGVELLDQEEREEGGETIYYHWVRRIE